MDTHKAQLKRWKHEAKGSLPCDHMLLEIEDDVDTYRPTGNMVCVSCGMSAPREEFYKDTKAT